MNWKTIKILFGIIWQVSTIIATAIMLAAIALTIVGVALILLVSLFERNGISFMTGSNVGPDPCLTVAMICAIAVGVYVCYFWKKSSNVRVAVCVFAVPLIFCYLIIGLGMLIESLLNDSQFSRRLLIPMLLFCATAFSLLHVVEKKIWKAFFAVLFVIALFIFLVSLASVAIDKSTTHNKNPYYPKYPYYYHVE